MDIAIVGAGGIGGCLAALLTEAGCPVRLLARGSHLAAISENGLTVIDGDNRRTIRPAQITDDAAAIGQPDLIILAVKAHQLAGAIDQIRPAVGPRTRLLPFQNGVDAPEMLAEAFGQDRALIGVARIFVNITGPGEITAFGGRRIFTIGTLTGTQSPVQDIVDLFRGANIDAPDHPDVRIDLWAKFILFNAVSSLTAGTRKRFGPVRETPETAALAKRLIRETWEVGRAEGVPLPENLIETTYKIITEQLPPTGRTSTAHDLEEGRPLEIDFTCGAVARRGRALGVDVTASETVYALLAPWRDGA